MRNNLIEQAESLVLRSDLPEIRVGQDVVVYVRIKEGQKERIQAFAGLVTSTKGTGSTLSFTVRKISYGIGVERTFMYHSPLISHVEVTSMNKIRRAKLYYMRERQGKSAKLKKINLNKKADK